MTNTSPLIAERSSRASHIIGNRGLRSPGTHSDWEQSPVVPVTLTCGPGNRRAGPRTWTNYDHLLKTFYPGPTGCRTGNSPTER
jgi:hypothetical protein